MTHSLTSFEKLFTSEGLRNSMGQAGRKRAQSVYDWSVIIPQYEALWVEQTRLRLLAQNESLGNKTALAHPWPARMDPFAAFASYPMHRLTENTLVVLSSLSTDLKTDALAKNQAIEKVEAYRQLSMVSFAKQVLPTPEEVKQLILNSSGTPQRAIELLKGIEVQKQAFVFRSLTWLMKLGVLSIAPEEKTSS